MGTPRQEGARFQSWRTTPFDVAASIARGLADGAFVARVTYAAYVPDYDPAEDGAGDAGDPLADSLDQLALADGNNPDAGGDAAAGGGPAPQLWDMTRPLVGSVARLEFLNDFKGDKDARTVFWHSSAHVLGEALERLHGSRLTVGPPLDVGSYYDAFMGGAGVDDGVLREDDCE